jgi:hypothetical protein
LSQIVSELGAPDSDRPISQTFAELCPADTVRVVDYLAPRVMAFFGDPATTLCIDKTQRVVRVLESIS